MGRRRIDFAVIFDRTCRVAQTCESPGAGWRAMCRLAADELGQQSIASIASLDLDAEARRARSSLSALMKKEPPPRAIDTLLFGLFDSVEGDETVAGYYVAGVIGFDPGDGDSLCDPAWWPKGRYLRSDALDAILAAARETSGDARTMLDYALRFGAAAVISRFAAEGHPHRIVVGFDDGDFAELTVT